MVLTDRSLGARLVRRFLGVGVALMAMASAGEAEFTGETLS